MILVTGSAGFIGFHVAKFLLETGHQVFGIDNLNSYYDVSLKLARNNILSGFSNYRFYRINMSDKNSLMRIFEEHRPKYVIHLAAQAGVRYSIEKPDEYIESNIVGFFNLLEACRKYPVEHLIYASSSSVYGGNTVVPFSTEHNVDHPVSLYAATKKSNELMAHVYSHLFGIPTTGLRFFTVYGPWGRPDMAYFKFTKNIIEGKAIEVYNKGNMERDFTYIDDIVEAIFKLLDKVPEQNPGWNEKNGKISESFAPYKIYNLGNNSPVNLEYFISILESEIGKKAIKVYKELQPGDVIRTYADVEDLEKSIGFRPKTKIEEGLKEFVRWFRDYYKV